jgi:hypothetical protein
MTEGRDAVENIGSLRGGKELHNGKLQSEEFVFCALYHVAGVR